MDEIDGVWRTIRGRRVFIKTGQSLSDAMRENENYYEKKYKMLSEEEINDFQKSSDTCYNKLSSNEKEAMYEYCMGGYQDVNDYLNGKFEGYENTEDFINQIDNAISKYNLENNIVTYRGVDSKYYLNHNVDDIFEEKMYYSTSLSKDIAMTFANDKEKPMLLEIRVPKKTKCIYIGDNTNYEFEAELLLGKDLNYKVINRTNNSMILEVVNETK